MHQNAEHRIQQGEILKISDLQFSVGEKNILKDINLNVAKGEFVGIIGPNGAGKTSLLKCINRINTYSGDIFIDGRDSRMLSQKEIARNVSLMFQNTNITFPFTALEVVLMGRYAHLRYGRSESRKDVVAAHEYLKYTGVSGLENQTVTSMSGGEVQRVLFAKVLAQEANLVLLDEPTSSLDIAYEEQIFHICSELYKEGKTVITSVHDIKIAARYCTRLILMKDGRIMADGTAEEVLTSENMSEAFSVNALVYRNRVTNSLDYHIFSNDSFGKGTRIHIIGGGGSASGVIRYLFERGYSLSAGVLSLGDSDLNTAELFGVKSITTQPFSGIDELAHAENERFIKNADITVLCNMPFGIGNLKNLEAAQSAKKLLIIEDEGASARDYTGGRGLELYLLLKEKAEVIRTSRLHEVL